MLCYICKEIMSESKEVLAFCTDLAGQHLEYCPQFWATCIYKRC